MKNWTEAEKTAWMSDTSTKEITVKFYRNDFTAPFLTLGDSQIIQESIELTQILESEKILTFSGANINKLKFKSRDIPQDVRGSFITVDLHLLGTSFPERNIFTGTVTTQENQTHEDIITGITAYDFMQQIYELDLTEWWRTLSIANGAPFGEYVRRINNKIAAETMATVLNDASLALFANMDEAIASKPDLIANYGTVTGEMLIKWIAQAGNVYITIVERKMTAVKLQPVVEGLHPHIGLYPRVGLYPRGRGFDKAYSDGDYISAKYEPYDTEKVDQVVITDTEGIGQGQAPTTPGQNAFYIEGNPFLQSMDMMNAANAIYERIKDVYLTPNTINAVGLPFVELGDVLKVHTESKTIFTYVLQRTLKGIQFLQDTFKNSADQYQEEHGPSFAEVSKDNNGLRILKLLADIVEVNELVATKVTADEVNAQIGNFDYTNTNALTAGTIDAADFTLGAGHISSLNANVINAGTLSAARIDSAIMRTANLYSSLAALNYVSMNSVSLNEILVNLGQTYTLKPKRVTIGGVAMTILASDN